MRRPRARRPGGPEIRLEPEPDPSDLTRARKTALDLLARREHSTVELEQKLIRRDFDASAVQQLLTSLVAEGLLSDERFAESFVASRVRRGQGPLRIRRELNERGVASSLANHYLGAYCNEWVDVAINARRKRFGDDPVSDFPERARQARFLKYRGFTTDQIMTALDANSRRAGHEL